MKDEPHREESASRSGRVTWPAVSSHPFAANNHKHAHSALIPSSLYHHIVRIIRVIVIQLSPMDDVELLHAVGRPHSDGHDHQPLDAQYPPDGQ